VIYSKQNAPGKGYPVVEYKEGLFLDYAWFDAKKIKPLFAFGHGLSYTTFEYSNLVISHAGTDPPVASVKITNSGSIAGHEGTPLPPPPLFLNHY
jgi:beta-glucosidase